MSEINKDILDLGFNSEEYTGQGEVIPYCQFINPVNYPHYGIGIKYSQAEVAGFKADDNWEEVEHQFSDRNVENLYLSQKPRLIILHQSKALMSKEGQTILYDANLRNEGWKSFSYSVVWFVDEDNNPLSELPFRLKLSGQAGMSFVKNYKYYSNPDSFTQKYLTIYQQLSGDKQPKNQLFYSHAVYCPKIEKKEAISKATNQSSWAAITTSFIEPDRGNILSLLINPKKRPELSDRIKEAIAATEDWIKIGRTDKEEDEILSNNHSQYFVEENNEYIEYNTANRDSKNKNSRINSASKETSYSPEQMDMIPF